MIKELFLPHDKGIIAQCINHNNYNAGLHNNTMQVSTITINFRPLCCENLFAKTGRD